jgi:arylsulfatase A-like enzyme
VDHGLYTAQRAVRTDRWKFVRTYHPGHWGPVTPERQLFDMQADPYEQDDVADSHPEVVDELETTMAVWAERHVGPSEDSLHRTARQGPAGASFDRNWGGI